MSGTEGEQIKAKSQSPVGLASPGPATPASQSQQEIVPPSDDAHVDNQMTVEHERPEDVEDEEEEEEHAESRSEATRYPPVPAQVLQNVKDLKDEILSGQHPTVRAPPGGSDADDEENEDKVDVVLKSFETKREQEDGREARADGDDHESGQDRKTGIKRDAENMLTTGQAGSGPSQNSNFLRNQHDPERDPKRARHEQAPNGLNRAPVERERTSEETSFRKPSFTDSRASRGELRPPPPGRSRSGSRTNTENSQPRTSTYNDRYLGPDTHGARSYHSDRNSVSNRSAATTYTDRLSTDSSRRDYERDRLQVSRSQRDSDYERGGPPRDARDFRRPDRNANDRQVSTGPPSSLDRDFKPALRDRISGAPPIRRPSSPISNVSNGGTRYSKPPIPRPDLYGDRPSPAGDRRTDYVDRQPPIHRERLSMGNNPGYDRQGVSRTSSMPDRTSDPRSFPPKNSTSYGDIRGSGPPSSRPPYSEQARASPPPSSIGSRYSKPPGGYRDDDPPRSNPNVTYSRPPVPRDSLGPPPARGSSPPRRAYDAPIGGSSVVPATRPYGYGANPPGPPEPYGTSRPGYDRYGPSGPPNDAYRERDRAPEYRAPPPSAPPPERYYPAANAPLPPVDTYTRSAYERQPPQYDRYGRPIPLEQALPPTYAAPARNVAPYAPPPPPASSVLDAELMDLKVRMAELERRREAEKMVAVAAPPPRSFPSGPPEPSYGSGSRGGLAGDRGYPPREREREREPVGYYPPRNGPPPPSARDSAYGPPINGPGDLPPRNPPLHRGPPRRSPPPLGRDDRPRR